MRKVLIALVLPAVLLAGCATSLHPTGSLDTSELKCSDYLKLSPTDRTDVAGTDTVLDYTADGVKTWDTTRKYDDELCAKKSNAESTLDHIAPKPPSCDDWKAVSATAKLAWIRAAVATTPGTSDLADADVVSTVAAACASMSKSEQELFSNATAEVDKIATQHGDDAKIATTLPLQARWTTTSKLGYTVDVLLQLANTPLGAGITGHPLSPSDTTAGTGCGYDPKTDIAIPARLYDVNTSATATPVQSAVRLAHTGFAVTTGSIDSGTYCSSEQSGGNVTLNIHQSTPVDAGSGWGIIFFVIIKNYYSPRYPSGALQELANYSLAQTSYTGSQLDDPVLEVAPTNAAISLSQVNAPH